MAANFPHSMPVGWFAVASSSDLESGAVHPVRYFDRELVVWRSDAGEPCVMDAFCPHLGAHLGVGGRVEGDTIRCPFHGWRFGRDGNCEEIPYAKRVPPQVRAETWPVLERNGVVWTWYATDDRAPFFEIPSLHEYDDTAWEEVHRRTWKVSTQIQEMAENGVDGAHFQTVHGAVALPDSEITVNGALRVAIQKAPLETKKGRATSIIRVSQAGLGFSFTRFSGICETTSFNYVTPIDANTIEFTVVFMQPVDAPAAGVTRAIIADLEKQVGEDIPIWENKIFRAKPALCDGDGPIAEFRQWCQQFYPN